MMTPPEITNSFQIRPGKSKVAIGAPHQGLSPDSDADQGTGPIACRLAEILAGRAVIVHDLRHLVDVNKNPLRLRRSVQPYAIHYQDELFTGNPRLVIEIHGHITGRYDVEISTGFDLDESTSGDARYLERLAILRESLHQAMTSQVGIQPSLGIFPLDRDVKQTATGTFTFQKIRRARHLAGVECYGLHIELNDELRTTLPARDVNFTDRLAKALASAIHASFFPLPGVEATISGTEPRYAHIQNGEGWYNFQVTGAPHRYIAENVVLVNPQELDRLGCRKGDAIILRHQEETLRSWIVPFREIEPGWAGLSARVRQQIDLERDDLVEIGVIDHNSLSSSQKDLSRDGLNALVSEIRSVGEDRLWLPPSSLAQAGLEAGEQVLVRGHPGSPQSTPLELRSDPSLPTRLCALSSSASQRQLLTLGEVIKIRACTGE